MNRIHYLILFFIVVLPCHSQVSIEGSLKIGTKIYRLSGNLNVNPQNKIEYLNMIITSSRTDTIGKIIINLYNNYAVINKNIVYFDTRWGDKLGYCIKPNEIENLKNNENIEFSSQEDTLRLSSKRIEYFTYNLPGKVQITYLPHTQNKAIICIKQIILLSLTEWNNYFQEDVILLINFKEGNND
jgi:hypothetical protein